LSSARIEELRKKFDENPRRYFAPLANEYRKAGDFDQAIFICQEYLPQQPGHMSGHIVFGQALFEAKRLPEAKTVFETALSLDPENLIALRHLADISRDLGDSTAATGWYERVLQADPRNEEVLAIVAQLASGAAPEGAAAAAAAPTAETTAKPTPGPGRTTKDAAEAPTVELSAAAVQELLKHRIDSKPSEQPKRDTLPEPMTLDTTPTVEIRVGETATMEGLEPTSHGGTVEMPAIEPLGLETNTAPGLHDDAPAPVPLDGLDTIPLDVSLPAAPPAAAAAQATTVEIPAIPASDDGLLDLGSFSIGGAAPANEPPPVAPPASEVPIDGGHEGGDLIDLDFDTPAPAPLEPAPAPAASSMPSMILDAVKTVVPAMQDAVKSVVPAMQDAAESAAPALMDLVDSAIPAVVDTVKSAVEVVSETPTIVMEAIRVPPKAEPPAPPAASSPERPSQSVPFVTETMAQLYLSQGHQAEAIDIYRKLIDARPNDSELKSRLAAIESEPPRVPVAVRHSPAAPAARFTGTGPSIRTVLRELFGFDGSMSYTSASAPAAAAGSVPAEVGSIDTLFSSAAVNDALNPLAVAFDGGYVAGQGSIDNLFAGGR
jgi:tetratricopeptide (TPR) repeat protein